MTALSYEKVWNCVLLSFFYLIFVFHQEIRLVSKSVPAKTGSSSTNNRDTGRVAVLHITIYMELEKKHYIKK